MDLKTWGQMGTHVAAFLSGCGAATWFQTGGLRWVVLKLLAWERARLVKAGATPEQIKAFEEHQAAMLQGIATTAKEQADAEKA